MATKKFKIGIIKILGTWDPDVDIEDYGLDKEGRLEIAYYTDDEKRTDRMAPQKVADWFGGRFVEWVYDEKHSLDGMVIEKEVHE